MMALLRNWDLKDENNAIYVRQRWNAALHGD